MNRSPFRVTLLYWVVLIFSTWNGLRLWTALAWRDVLTEFSASQPPIVTAISGGLWMLAGIILLWSIWQNKAWTANLLVGIAASYSIWYWVEQFAWENLHPNWTFAVIVNLAGIVFILFNARLLSRERNEQKNENRAID